MWTTYNDVQERWIGGSLPADETQIATLIGDAEDTILREFPTIQTRIDNDELPIERVTKVVSRMVIRHINNPTGTRSKTEGAGPYQQTITYGGDEPGTLYLTADDRRELQVNDGRKAFTIDTAPQTAGYVQEYLDWIWWTPL